MPFEPRIPLVVAETLVDWDGHQQHIVERRGVVERACNVPLRRVAYAAAHTGAPSQRQLLTLENVIRRQLEQTARFGHREARRELAALREQHPVQARAVDDAGMHGRVADEGLAGVNRHVRRRARDTASAILAGILGVDRSGDPDAVRLAVLAAAGKVLHNQVLELVGETLNLGRAAGALSMREPPQFAFRSEQLDKATCDSCTRLHGAIVEIGSDSFYEYMPPAGCYGGGRCRGIYIFADGPQQLRGPATPPGPQPELPPIPPVQLPRRKAA